MNKSDMVVVRKLSAADNAPVPTPVASSYSPGEINLGKSVPVQYEIEGKLLTELVVGQPFRVLRDKRNGVECFGIFETSHIVSISSEMDRVVVCTENSMYDVRLL